MDVQMDEILDQIDEMNIRRKAEIIEEKKIASIRHEEIRKIYTQYNPEKLSNLDALFDKYEGKEHELLKQIRKKYCEQPKRERAEWSFVLKRFASKRETRLEQERSLLSFRKILDDLALSIGGELVDDVTSSKNGVPVLIVRKAKGVDTPPGHNIDSIKDTVERMRSIVHERYAHDKWGKSIAHLHTEEHERRKEDKRADLAKKKGRRDGRKRGFY